MTYNQLHDYILRNYPEYKEIYNKYKISINLEHLFTHPELYNLSTEFIDIKDILTCELNLDGTFSSVDDIANSLKNKLNKVLENYKISPEKIIQVMYNGYAAEYEILYIRKEDKQEHQYRMKIIPRYKWLLEHQVELLNLFKKFNQEDIDKKKKKIQDKIMKLSEELKSL